MNTTREGQGSWRRGQLARSLPAGNTRGNITGNPGSSGLTGRNQDPGDFRDTPYYRVRLPDGGTRTQ